MIDMFSNSIRYVFFVTLLVLAAAHTPASAQNKGKFVGDLVIKSIKSDADGNSFELIQDFSFIDGGGRTWTAPKGIHLDGASIPSFFWPIVGEPWGEGYREASAIHDHFCRTKSRPWKDVHRAFYEAMLLNNVSSTTAKIMYYAVYRFGPRWTDTKKNFEACLAKFYPDAPSMDIADATTFGSCFGPVPQSVQLTWSPKIYENEAKELIEEISERDLSLEQIENISNENIREKTKYQRFLNKIVEESKSTETDYSGLIDGIKELRLAD